MTSSVSSLLIVTKRSVLSIFYIQGRHIRARWERPYLKDLYHRRMLAGADPVISRSAYPNWNYDSEIYAFGHRIGAPEIDKDVLIRSLTDSSFYQRADIAEESANAQPSKQESYEIKEHNSQLTHLGSELIWKSTCAYLRYGFPHAPEELITSLALKLIADEQIANLATYLGINNLIRTAEFPPSNASLCNAFKALIATLPYQRAIALIRHVIVAQLVNLNIEEVFPLAEPFAVLQCFMSSTVGMEIEPRLLRSAGEVSAEPIFVAGIYANEKLIGQGPGETISIAVDMAAMDALMRCWRVTADRRFPFTELDSVGNLDCFMKPHYSLQEICGPSLVLKFVDLEEEQEPINVKEVALRYKREIEATAGIPLRRRLRHKFSRGTFAKRTFRYINKPKIYQIC
uniref:Large ribosomal subunit protein mL44 n=1 Tax=Elaeophora elaphi TaxID=1147741 RepID=A0A0R3RU24_9BILA